MGLGGTRLGKLGKRLSSPSSFPTRKGGGLGCRCLRDRCSYFWPLLSFGLLSHSPSSKARPEGSDLFGKPDKLGTQQTVRMVRIRNLGTMHAVARTSVSSEPALGPAKAGLHPKPCLRSNVQSKEV